MKLNSEEEKIELRKKLGLTKPEYNLSNFDIISMRYRDFACIEVYLNNYKRGVFKSAILIYLTLLEFISIIGLINRNYKLLMTITLGIFDQRISDSKQHQSNIFNEIVINKKYIVNIINKTSSYKDQFDQVKLTKLKLMLL